MLYVTDSVHIPVIEILSCKAKIVFKEAGCDAADRIYVNNVWWQDTAHALSDVLCMS